VVTLASQAEIGTGGASAGSGGIAPGKKLRFVRNAVHNAFLSTLTMGTAFTLEMNPEPDQRSSVSLSTTCVFVLCAFFSFQCCMRRVINENNISMGGASGAAGVQLPPVGRLKTRDWKTRDHHTGGRKTRDQ